ncbi:hypothetical protein C8R46DRAFT_666263 [Mycena filopes]|nr:hypothetical protein C8R46DRAFT_666263 [Mycena filopes]
MFTKFITIAVLFAAPLLSAAAPAPAPFWNLGGIGGAATVTIFRYPASASASPSAVISSAVVIPSPAAPVAGGGGVAAVAVPPASQVTDVLTGLRNLSSLLGGLPSTISGVTNTVNTLTNLLSSVTGALTGFTGQISQVQNQVNSLGPQLISVASQLAALSTATPSTGSTNGDPTTAIQGLIATVTNIVAPLNSLTTAAQNAGSPIDMENVQQALQTLTSQCLVDIPNLSNQCATAAGKKLVNDALKVLQGQLTSCSDNMN